MIGSACCQLCGPQRAPSVAGLHGSILRAGTLWLVGVCGSELQAAPWGEAFQLAVQHLGHSDVVVRRLGLLPATLLVMLLPLPTWDA